MTGTALVLRWAVALVLLWAGVEKARDIRAFAVGLHRYRLLPVEFVTPAARGIVLIELTTGVALLAGIATPAPELMAAALFLVFTGALTVVVRRGDDIPCHCFGESDTENVSGFAIVRSLTLAAAALAVAVLPADRPESALAPALSTAIGLVLLLRLMPFVPKGVEYLRAPAVTWRGPTRRMSFRHLPLTVSLHGPIATVPPASLLSHGAANPESGNDEKEGVDS